MTNSVSLSNITPAPGYSSFPLSHFYLGCIWLISHKERRGNPFSARTHRVRWGLSLEVGHLHEFSLKPFLSPKKNDAILRHDSRREEREGPFYVPTVKECIGLVHALERIPFSNVLRTQESQEGSVWKFILFLPPPPLLPPLFSILRQKKFLDRKQGPVRPEPVPPPPSPPRGGPHA